MKNRSAWYIICMFSFLLCSYEAQANTPQQVDNALQTYQQAKHIFYEQPYAASQKFAACIETFKAENHVKKLLDCYISLSRLHGALQNYTEAFDYGWEAVLLAENQKDSLQLARACATLGQHYNHFGKREESSMLLKRSNQIFSALVQQGKAETQALISSYFNLAMYYRWFNKQDSVKMYVDTCLMLSERYNQKPIDRAYITAEIASMAKLPEEKEQALQQFETVKRIFEQQEQNPNASFKNKSFLAIVYFYLGNFYLQCHNYQLSVRYNQKALKTIEKYNWHRATKALILENLSKAQHQLGFYNKAYQNLSQAKHLGDALFSARSLRNSNLVNIKNKYEEKVSQQQAQLLQKEKELNHQRKSIFLFRIALISLLFSLAVFILIMLNKRQKSKFNEEKLQSEQLLEQKNKELTAFTLKLIEKEELVEQLTNELENLAQNNTQALSLVNSIKNGSKVLWDEFNTRFLEVNNGFYERLQTQYPNLSQTELKHCALIKLNFSSKEMAHLLGISPTSVHVSRHRIRKKMQLDREVNLSRFIAAI